MNIRPLARVDLLLQRAFKRPVLVQDDGQFPIARADDQINVPGDRLLQSFARVGDGADFANHRLFQDVHPIILDLVKQPFLAADVVVKPGFGEANGFGNILHGSAGESLFVEHPRRNAANLAASFVGVCGLLHKQVGRSPLGAARVYHKEQWRVTCGLWRAATIARET